METETRTLTKTPFIPFCLPYILVHVCKSVWPSAFNVYRTQGHHAVRRGLWMPSFWPLSDVKNPKSASVHRFRLAIPHTQYISRGLLKKQCFGGRQSLRLQESLRSKSNSCEGLARSACYVLILRRQRKAIIVFRTFVWSYTTCS